MANSNSTVRPLSMLLQGITNASETLTTDSSPLNSSITSTTSLFDLSGLVILILLLIPCIVFGCLSNAVYLYMLIRQNGEHKLRNYGYVYSMTIVNLVLCSVWSILYIVENALLYEGNTYQGLCTFTTAVHCLAICVTFFNMLFLIVQNFVWKLAEESSNTIVIVGLAFSWVFALSSAIFYGAGLSNWKSEYYCKFWIIPLENKFNLAALILSGISVFTVAIALGLLCLSQHQTSADSTPNPYVSPHKNGCQVQSDQDAEASAKSYIHKLVAREPTIGGSFSRKRENTSVSPQLIYVKGTTNEETSTEDNESDIKKFEEQGTSFSRQGSGSNRRYTTGSITTPSESTGAAQNYSYIRKWSVDIVALQNQLENPKIHGGDYPFCEIRENVITEHAVCSETPKKSISPVVEDQPSNINASDQITSTSNNKQQRFYPVKRKVTSTKSNADCKPHFEIEVKKTALRKVLSDSNSSNKFCRVRKISSDSLMRNKMTKRESQSSLRRANVPHIDTKGFLRLDVSPSHSHPTVKKLVSSQQNFTLNRTVSHIKLLRASMVLTIVFLCTLTPYILVKIFRNTMSVSLYVNLSIICTSFIALQATLQPHIFVFMDSSFHARVQSNAFYSFVFKWLKYFYRNNNQNNTSNPV